MAGYKNMIKEYFLCEDAKEEIVTVVLTVLGLAVATGIGWWIWSVVQNQVSKQSCSTNNDIFCIED